MPNAKKIEDYLRSVSIPHQKLEIEKFIRSPEFIKVFCGLLFERNYLTENALYEGMKDLLFDQKERTGIFGENDPISEMLKGKIAAPDEILRQCLSAFEENKKLLWLIYFYAYKLDFRKDVTDDDLKEINNFVKNGII